MWSCVELSASNAIETAAARRPRVYNTRARGNCNLVSGSEYCATRTTYIRVERARARSAGIVIPGATVID